MNRALVQARVDWYLGEAAKCDQVGATGLAAWWRDWADRLADRLGATT